MRRRGGEGRGRTDEKCDRVENVAQNELQSQLVDAEAAADPGEQTVDGCDEGQDSEHVAEDLACNDETEQGALGKGVQCVHGCVLLVLATINDDSSTRYRLLQLWYAELADRHRRGYTHHRCSNKVLSGDTKADISAQNGAGDGGESLNG